MLNKVLSFYWRESSKSNFDEWLLRVSSGLFLFAILMGQTRGLLSRAVLDAANYFFCLILFFLFNQIIMVALAKHKFKHIDPDRQSMK